MDEWENELINCIEKEMEERWLFVKAILFGPRIRLVWSEDELEDKK